ncbi:hypothetical protein O1Q79_01495 [Lonepinella sp. MS14434]|uniref:YadA-like family protein n=1 Tax=Lonepinella sp. MS14434 TaxID=3003617 RepID=UPI0036D838B6
MNHIYKVIWSQVANAFIAVSELASSRGKTNAIKTATPVSSITNTTTQFGLPFKLDKIAALTVLFMSPFYATARDVNADDLIVSGTASVTGTSTFIGAATFNGGITTDSLTVNGTNISNKISTLETDISSKANQTDLIILSDKVDNKADQSDLTILKDTVDTKANKSEVKVLTDTVATKASQTDLNNLNTKVTTLDSTKADKTELNTLNNTVIANKKLFDTLNASVNTLGLTSTYSGIKYFRVKSTAADAQATGDNALAAGPEAIANASKAVAVGHQAHATHVNSTALGSNAWATGNNSVATGANTSAKANDSVAVGGNAKVENSAEQGIAIGSDSRVGTKPTGDLAYDGASDAVVGDGESTIAIGDNATGRGNSNIAIGKDALTANKDAEKAFATDSIAMGTSARTIASSSAIAIGNKAEVQKSSDSAIAIGDNAKVAATTAVAVGPNTTASGVASTAVGSSATAGGASATAIGSNSTASAPSGVAIGDSASSAASKTISIGLNAGKGQQAGTSGTKNSHINIGELSGENVDGQLNIAIGKQAGSNVRGKGNIAVGTEAGMNIVGSDESLGDNVAIGTKANSYSTQTNVQFATALGALTTASSGSSALGYTANATGEKSVAVGYGANASGSQSLALGLNSNASGVDNVALGSTSVAATKSREGYLTGNVSDTVVSVGNDNLSRRIVNVADGADDSDAVTVAQLKRVSDDVYNKVNANISALSITAGSGINYDVIPREAGNNSITLNKDKQKTIIGSVADGVLADDAVNLGQLRSEINKEKTHYFSTKVNGSELGNYNNNGATGNVSLAAGQAVLASGDNSIAIGNYVTAQGTGSIAIGSKYEGSAALDDGVAKPSETKTISGSQVFQYNMAIGAGASSEGNNSIAIGSLASTSTKDATTENVDRAIALGYYAVSSAEKANAIGDRARSTGLTSNAFGSEANATGTSSTAIGTTAQASGTNSIAFGTNQKVSGTNSGSIGYAGDGTTANTTSVSGSGTYSVGNMNSGITAKESGVFGNDNILQTSENTRVVGNLNTIGNVTTATPGGAKPVNNLKDIYVTGYGNTISSGEKLAEDLSGLFVYGHNNTVAQIDDAASTEKVEITDSSIIGANNTLNTSGSDYFILGNNVTATLQNSVYLGNASAYVASGTSTSTSTKGMDSYASIVDNSATYTFAGSTPTGVVTVGAVGQERRVQNVAAGLVTSASTDAINGSQLYALTRPLRFAGDNSALSNQDGGNVTQNADTNVISRNSNQAIDITGGETEASKLTTKTDKNIGVIVTDNNSMEIRLAKELTNLTSATFGSDKDKTVINKNGVTITNDGKANVSLTDTGLDNGNNTITNVSSGLVKNTDGSPVTLANATGDTLTNAVNVGDLKGSIHNVTNATAGGGFGLTDDNGNPLKQDLGTTVKVVGKDGITTTVNSTSKEFEIGLGNNVTIGGKNNGSGNVQVVNQDGDTAIQLDAGNATVTVGSSGEAGSISLDGTDGSISIIAEDGTNATITVANGTKGIAGNDLNGEENKTRITYEKSDGTTEEVATLNDGLYFVGDKGQVIAKKLNETLSIKGNLDTNAAVTDKNLRVDNENGELIIKMAKALQDLTNAIFISSNGKSVIDGNGFTITPTGKDSVSLTDKGLNNGNNTITNVSSGLVKNTDGSPVTLANATGDTLTNAVNVGDLKGSIHNVTNATAGGGFGLTDDNGNPLKQDLGTTVKVVGKDGITTTVNSTSKEFEIGLGNNVTIGGKNNGSGNVQVVNQDGDTAIQLDAGNATVTVGSSGEAGSISLDGTDGSISIIAEDGTNATITVANGTKGIDGNDLDGGNNKTRITYEKSDGTTEEVATLNDGLYFVGDKGQVIAKKLNETLSIKGNLDTTAAVTDENLRVDNENGELIIKMAKALQDLTNATFISSNGKSVIDGNGFTITPTGKDSVSLTDKGLNNGNNTITNVSSGLVKNTDGSPVTLANATGDTLTNAVNVGDLKDSIHNVTNATAGGGFGLTDDNGNPLKQDLGTTVKVVGKDGITTTVNSTSKEFEIGLGNDVTIGGKNNGSGNVQVVNQDGDTAIQLDAGNATVTVGSSGEAGSISLDGTDGSISIIAEDGTNATITVANGTKGIAGNDLNGEENKTRITYEKSDGTTEEVATLNDGLYFVGDKGQVIAKKLNETLSIKGNLDTNAAVTDKNLRVDNENGELIIKMAKALQDLTNATFISSNGKSVIDGNGFTITPKGKDSVSLTDKGLNNGNNTITNVKAGVDGTDAVNVDQLEVVNATANAGWKLTDGTNDSTVKPNDTVSLTNTDGNLVIKNDKNNVTFDLAKDLDLGSDGSVKVGDTTINNDGVKVGDNVKLTKEGLTAGNTTVTDNGLTITGGPSVTKSGINAGNQKITHLDKGELLPTSTDAVNGSQLYQTNENVTNLSNEVAKGWNVTTGVVEGSTGTVTGNATAKVAMGDTVSVKAGNNIAITQDGKNISIATSLKPTFEKVTTETVTVGKGSNTATIGTTEDSHGKAINIAGSDGSSPIRITNVAPGIGDTDAVNVSQLKNVSQSVSKLDQRVSKLDKRVRGIGANAAAASALPQVYIPGKSMVAAAGGAYSGASALAIGYSRASDNGKVIIKLNGTANSEGHYSGGVGIGYQW